MLPPWASMAVLIFWNQVSDSVPVNVVDMAKASGSVRLGVALQVLLAVVTSVLVSVLVSVLRVV